jgi:hypothetical protein
LSLLHLLLQEHARHYQTGAWTSVTPSKPCLTASATPSTQWMERRTMGPATQTTLPTPWAAGASWQTPRSAGQGTARMGLTRRTSLTPALASLRAWIGTTARRARSVAASAAPAGRMGAGPTMGAASQVKCPLCLWTWSYVQAYRPLLLMLRPAQLDWPFLRPLLPIISPIHSTLTGSHALPLPCCPDDTHHMSLPDPRALPFVPP